MKGPAESAEKAYQLMGFGWGSEVGGKALISMTFKIYEGNIEFFSNVNQCQS